MISTLNLLSLGTYILSFLYIILSTSLYSLSLNIFTPAYFIFLTALIISLSFTFDYLTSSNKSTPSMMISTFFVFLTSSYSSFINISFLLSLFISTSQSSLLLRLSVFSILLPGIYFNVKSNLDKYNVYLVITWQNS